MSDGDRAEEEQQLQLRIKDQVLDQQSAGDQVDDQGQQPPGDQEEDQDPRRDQEGDELLAGGGAFRPEQYEATIRSMEDQVRVNVRNVQNCL